MRTAAFATVRDVESVSEAQNLVCALRQAGMHPVDLSVATPLRLPGTKSHFPIQVPAQEAEAAQSVLRNQRPSAAA